MKTNNSNPTQGREVYVEKRLAIICPPLAPRYEIKICVLRNATDEDIYDALVTESEQFTNDEITQGVILSVFAGDDLNIREYQVVTDNKFDFGYSEQRLLDLIREEVKTGGRGSAVEYSEADSIIIRFREQQSKIMSTLGKRSAQRRKLTSEQMRELANKRWKK